MRENGGVDPQVASHRERTVDRGPQLVAEVEQVADRLQVVDLVVAAEKVEQAACRELLGQRGDQYRRAAHETQHVADDRLLVGVVHLANVSQRPVMACAVCVVSGMKGRLSPTVAGVLVTLAAPLSRRDPTRRRDSMNNSEPDAEPDSAGRPGATIATRGAGAPPAARGAGARPATSWPDVIDLRRRCRSAGTVRCARPDRGDRPDRSVRAPGTARSRPRR